MLVPYSEMVKEKDRFLKPGESAVKHFSKPLKLYDLKIFYSLSIQPVPNSFTHQGHQQVKDSELGLNQSKTQKTGFLDSFFFCGGGGGGGLVSKSCLTLATPWVVAHQAFLSMGFPRQEYWSG